MEKNATFGLYKRKEMYFNYMTGNFLEVNKIASQILKDLIGSKNVQLQIQQIESIIYLADEIIFCNQLEIAASIFYLMLEQIKKIKDSSNSQLVGKAYMGLALIHYTLQEYNEAARCSILFYETNKQQNIEGLVIAYISYKQLDLIDQANNILQTIKSQANVDESLNIQKYILHSQLFKFINIFSNKIDQIQKEEAKIRFSEKSRERKAIWDGESEVKQIYNFIHNGQIEEGIMHYKQILKQLNDPDQDYFMKLEVLEVISILYAAKREYSQAIETRLDIHQKLLKKRNYLVINDNKHMQNFENLINIYITIKEDNKALEWHKKFHSYLLINGYFTNFSLKVRDKLLGHMDCLVRLQQYEEALEYADFIERYANQFQLEKEYPQYYNELKSRKLQLTKFLKDNSRLKKEYLQYYEFLKTFKNNDTLYQCLVYLLNFSFQDQDEQGIIKYSESYLQLRGKYEKEDENLKNIVLMYILLIQHYYERKQYEKASKFITDAKPFFKKNKLFEELYCFLLIQICLIRNLKLQDDINEKAQEAANLFNQHFKGTNLEGFITAKGLLFQSRTYFDLGDYQICLDHFEKFLKQDQAKDLFNKEFQELLNNLLQQNECKQKVEEIISKYQLKSKF
ncbi:hypothetical protein TTHERM_000343939 (macronuclear) [Tetrahymena thermophila SB210]|uniref:Tetratricopeptide repeat protein n=1 Tax=Tetrahymena thermophila (strain SB210) TaxID=312017 RepID=W7X8Y0_TETTS|nr:hypothetical protein TTHERM_000343939 [Tetrahymena thermophila SB210]EWS73787.1 hypothetical protein TTHERM_000343939 [Tetrahymena thermophila SB210]|eukprot:XP_012653667.1 hypothetical protein TTHERM_000343939 [Tetrahymena thermophila SB210]